MVGESRTAWESTRRWTRLAWAVAGVSALAACGGGRGNVTAPTPAPTAPTTTQTTTTQTTTTGAATTAPSTPSAPFIPGEVERTTFSPGLNVQLDKMVRRPSGLYVQDIETGTGNVAAGARTAVLRYSGYLPDGKQFDSGEISVALGAGKVIRAWEEGVLGMRVGGRRRIVSPPHLAYGARGAPPDIPPNAVLVFDLELLQVY